MTDQQKIYQLALQMTPGIGDVLIKLLVSYFGSAENVFKANKIKLDKVPGIGSKISGAIIKGDFLKEAEKEIDAAARFGTKILFYTDKEYPFRLKQVYDAPSVLFYKGNADLNQKKVVAIVGTRQATPYGKAVVEEIVKDLASYDVLLVSGLAYGIDIHAHRCALNYNISTVGVMGSGVDIIYPAAHKNTAFQMTSNGGIMSELRMGSKPDAHNFPARNRIIAGMSDVVIVAEASEKGGALITADIANSYDREVFAVPGNLHQNFSEGCNKLVSTNKAHIYTGIKDFEMIMNWDVESIAIPKKYQLPDLTSEEITVVNLLQDAETGLQIDEMSWKSQISLNQMASILLTLEFKGLIKALPGKKFKLTL